MTCLSSAAEMWPSLFLSKTCGAEYQSLLPRYGPTLNASRISSSESVSCIFRAIKVMNSAALCQMPRTSSRRGLTEVDRVVAIRVDLVLSAHAVISQQQRPRPSDAQAGKCPTRPSMTQGTGG